MKKLPLVGMIALAVSLIVAGYATEPQRGPGLPISRVVGENGLTLLATEIAVLPRVETISSKLSVQVIGAATQNGKRLASPIIAMRVATANSVPIWEQVKTLTLSYAGKRLSLPAVRNTSLLSTGLTAEILTVRVPYSDFNAMAKAGKFFVVVQGNNIEVNTWNSTGIRVLANRLAPSSVPQPRKTRVAKAVAKPTVRRVRLTAKQKQLAFASLKLLRRMASATEVGLSLMEYKSRLIDTKSDIDEYLRALPQNAVRKDLQAAIDAYVDAGTLWASSMEWDRRQSFSTINAVLLKKYSIPPTLSYNSFSEMGGELTQGDKMFTLNVVWLAASLHMQAAEKMLG